MNWYKVSGSGIMPVMDNPVKNPYLKKKTGVQNDEGISQRLSPGATGMGSDDRNSDLAGGKVSNFGTGADNQRSEGYMPSFQNDGGDAGGSNYDTARPIMSGDRKSFDPSISQNSLTQSTQVSALQMSALSGDNRDKKPNQLGVMSVFDTIHNKLKK